MATRKIAYGAATSFSSSANTQSLANNAAKPLGKVSNNSTLAIDYTFSLEFKLGSSGVSATGTVEIWLIESTDDSDYTDGINPDSSSDIASSIKNARLLSILTANANSQVIKWVQGLVGAGMPAPVTACPQYWAVIVYNKSGATMSATAGDHDSKYQAITETVA